MLVPYHTDGCTVSNKHRTYSSTDKRNRSLPRLPKLVVPVISVCSIDDIPEGEAFRFQADVPIAVFNTGDALYAIDDTCTHQDASLADGFVEDGCVECPLHAACFDLRTGMPSGPPAKQAVRTHQVIVSESTVYVAISETPTEAPVEAPVGEEIGVA